MNEPDMKSNKMCVIALTGGIGCGKSAAAAFFSSLGVPIVDVDVIAHTLTSSNQANSNQANSNPTLVQRLAEEFGAEFITPEGALDREKMRQLVFNDVPSRLKLESILHPAIYARAVQMLDANSATTSESPYQILAIPLLTADSAYQPIIDRVLVIDCDEPEQIKRTMQRSKLSMIEVRNIIAAQISRQARLALADDVIENNGNLSALQQSVLKVNNKYINTCLVSK